MIDMENTILVILEILTTSFKRPETEYNSVNVYNSYSMDKTLYDI